ncbi:hypothetical protein CDAR_553791 [Caerostris darwini]|uniref:Uncharacterized protein n=1 Tax=Caerostris darwini TaxID=1538125 RepID=A0AAV4WMM0_9ARAC|nr:hypothetical protein CDAR_553791 [Caerostris darwini]
MTQPHPYCFPHHDPLFAESCFQNCLKHFKDRKANSTNQITLRRCAKGNLKDPLPSILMASNHSLRRQNIFIKKSPTPPLHFRLSLIQNCLLPLKNISPEGK